MKDHYDVCVYGATSGGVVAAVALARKGYSVALEPYVPADTLVAPVKII